MPPITTLEDQISALSTRLEAVEARLARLEGREPLPAPGRAAAPPPAVADEMVGAGLGIDGKRLTTALGRSFIILGGAFLLRALTEAGIWPPMIGVAVGLLYGLGWMAMSVTASHGVDRTRALFDGATALVIGFPLVLEAAVKFNLLGPGFAAAALALVTAGSLVAAALARFQTVAWLAVLGGMFTGLALMVRLGVVVPYALYFVGLGVATLWIGYLREWKLLRWPAGMLAAFAVFGVTTRALGDPPLDRPLMAWLVQAALVISYFASIAVRTLVRGRQVIVFEVVQTVIVLIVGVGGALAVSRSAGSGSLVIGGSLVVLGGVAYLVSFAFLPRDSAAALNFYFYSSLALIFVLTGLAVSTDGAAQAVALTTLAALLAVAWRRSGRVTLGGHAAVALVVASISGGLLTVAETAFAGELPAIAVLGTAGFTLIVALTISGTRMAGCHLPRPFASDTPAIVIGLLALAGTAGAVTVVMGRAAGWSAADAGLLATARTALLSGLAVLAAWLHRPGRFSSIGTIAYPLLAAIGIKLVLSDLRDSSAATLFIALACYGAALVLVPRMHRAA
ncbi:MAG TPA: hypothetical protein VL263_06205 [Vicinamibacterales bacterium]|nr:hypothetical protein [Vicinamibacterales bacterium]